VTDGSGIRTALPAQIPSGASVRDSLADNAANMDCSFDDQRLHGRSPF